MAQRAEGEFWDKERIKKRGEEGRGQFGVVSMYTIHCLHVKKNTRQNYNLYMMNQFTYINGHENLKNYFVI